MINNLRQKGFTIVELLIVIVVIAILAAITIVAYNGVQTRSRNTAQVSGANGYEKLLKLYKAANGDYPSDTGCLGTNNIDTNSDGLADCGDNGSTTVNTTLNNKLSTMGTLPNVITTQILGTSGVKRAGIFWYYPSLSLIWFVQGSPSDCKIPTAGGGADGTSVWCIDTLN